MNVLLHGNFFNVAAACLQTLARDVLTNPIRITVGNVGW